MSVKWKPCLGPLLIKRDRPPEIKEKMKTSNRAFKFLDSCFGGAVLLFAGLLARLLGFLGLLHRTPEPRKILFSKFCCQGDALLALYAIRSFREKYPNAEVCIAASRKTEEVFKSSGIADSVICLSVSGNGVGEFLSAGIIRFFKELIRSGPFDTVIDMDLYYRFSVLIGIFLGAGTRIGFSFGDVRGTGFTGPVERKRKQHERRCFYDLLAPFGIVYKDQPPIKFPFLTKSLDHADRLLQERGHKEGVVLIGLFPGSSIHWPCKRWPLVSFLRLIELVRAEGEAQFAVFGQESEQDLGNFLKMKAPATVIDLTGKTDFKILGACLSRCILFIGNDSGPMHYADMLGVPVIGLFGPTDEAKWRPLGERSVVVINSASGCRPCYYLSSMPDCKHLDCMTGITPEQVVAHVQRIISPVRGQGH
jgi:heptosyltransferase-2/heptosyltransferase-3